MEPAGSGHVEAQRGELAPPAGEGPEGWGWGWGWLGFQGADPRVVAWPR